MKRILFCILISLIVTGCKNNENNINTIKPDNDNKIITSEKSESKTHINTNGKYQEIKNVEGLTFANASLIKIDSDCLFEVTVKNMNQESVQFEHIKINLLDYNNNSIIELNGIVTEGILKSNEEKIISSYYNGEIDKVVDVKYEIIK